MNQGFHCFPSGDSALIIKTGDEISAELNRKVRKILQQIEKEKSVGIVEFIPSYNELMIFYDPLVLSFRKLLDMIHSIGTDIEETELPPAYRISVPVLYGGEVGSDLQVVAQFNNLPYDEVIKIHSSGDYMIFMLGFTPGFCYLGGMDKRIATPRKQSPRLKIPAGAVGIADKQTGIYPIESPGGWQLIGQTPLQLFNSTRYPEFLFNPGDFIRFCPVDFEEFGYIRNEVIKGFYVPEKSLIS